MSHSARDTALKVLIACRTHGAWADAALKAQLARDQLSPQDAALCSRMVYGVTQNRLLLDFYLAAYCSQKPDHLQPPLLDILRLGAYQILFLDKVPGRRQRSGGTCQTVRSGSGRRLGERCATQAFPK